MTAHPTNDSPASVEEILTKLENEVAADITSRMMRHSSRRSPKSSHAEATARIEALLVEARQSEREKWYAKLPSYKEVSKMTKDDLFSALATFDMDLAHAIGSYAALKDGGKHE